MACLVRGEFGLSSSADEAHVVSLAHHLDQAHASIEVYTRRRCESTSCPESSGSAGGLTARRPQRASLRVEDCTVSAPRKARSRRDGRRPRTGAGAEAEALYGVPDKEVPTREPAAVLGAGMSTPDLLQNPVLSPTAKQLQSSLNETDRTAVALGVSRGVRVFMLTWLPGLAQSVAEEEASKRGERGRDAGRWRRRSVDQDPANGSRAAPETKKERDRQR